MPKMAACVCGQQFRIPDQSDIFLQQCPACGRDVDPSQAKPVLPDPPPDPPKLPAAAERVRPDVDDEPPLLLRLLLDPITIQRLLGFGGALTVLGILAWLVSLGVFDDPRILAVALGAGTMTLLCSGWAVVLRTRYRLAGQALTFLACVVLPLNLWFYDAQGLLTVDGHLWLGGLVCSLLYLATVWKLRDPLFLYAVEAGITLTVMLLLGDLHRFTDCSAICLAMVVLAVVSIHAEAAFDPHHPTLNRHTFGRPLFLSGQVQLAIGMVSLLGLQILKWVDYPGLYNWTSPLLVESSWLAAGVWLAAAYLWIYSDVVLQRFSTFTYLAVVALVFVEVTLLKPYLPTEGLIITLSLNAMLAQVLCKQFSEPKSRWSFIADKASTIIGGVGMTIGLVRHFDLSVGLPISDPRLLAIAMCSIAANLGYQGVSHWTRYPRRAATLVICAGISAWVGTMHSLHVLHVDTLTQQTPFLILIPVASLLLVQRFRKQDNLAAAVIHSTVILGLMLSALSVRSSDEWFEMIVSDPGNVATFHTAILSLELAVLYFVTRSTAGSNLRRFTVTLGCLSALISGGKLLIFVDLPDVWFGPLLASVGISLTILERVFWSTTQGPDASSTKPRQQEQVSLVGVAGNFILVLGELAAFFQTLPWLIRTIDSIPVTSVTAILLTSLVATVGCLLSRTRSLRGWHGFAAAIITASLGLAWLRTLRLADYQKFEILLESLGLIWLGAGCVARLRENDGLRKPLVSLAFWAGSIAAAGPVWFFTMMNRWSSTGPSLGDEIALLTITMLMVAVGCVLQIRATTAFGGVALGSYLVVLFGHLVYHPQVTVGVYLAAGGALIFATGVVLSVYRERLSALPSKIANREGIFQVMDWR